MLDIYTVRGVPPSKRPLGEPDVVHAESVGVEAQELHLEAVPTGEAVEDPVGGSSSKSIETMAVSLYMPARVSCDLRHMSIPSGESQGFTAWPPTSPLAPSWPRLTNAIARSIRHA